MEDDMESKECFYLDNGKKKYSQKLYQEIFTEDSEDFVNYYYENIGKRNKILAMKEKEDNCLIAMLHQNPHDVLIGQAQLKTEYIYGVAVSKRHRHKGYMGKMVKRALSNIFEENIYFTYLFPISKGLYEKFGFGYVDQFSEKLHIAQTENESSVVPLVSKEVQGSLNSMWDRGVEQTKAEWKEAEAFIRNDFQRRQGVYLMQSASYLKEWLEMSRRNGEQGDIFIYKKQNKIKAILKVAENKVIEEIGDMGEVEEALNLWTRLFKKTEQCMEQNADCETELPAMVRILHLEKLLYYLSFPERIDITFSITDDLFPENQGVYRVQHGKGKKIQENCERQMHIRDFTQWLFSIVPFQIKDQI